MKLFLRLLAGLIELVAVFLIYAVIAAFASTNGARVGVCIAYVAGAVVLSYLAMRLWRRSSGGGKKVGARPAA